VILNNPLFAGAIAPGVTLPLEADTTHYTPVAMMELLDICYRALQNFPTSLLQ
jgi:hypothetical protein